VRSAWLAWGVLAATACTVLAPLRAPLEELAAAEQPETASCDTSACQTALAEFANAAGMPDVASFALERAFVLADDAATLEAWLDALLVTGQLRRLELALTDARVRQHTAVIERFGELRARVGASALDSRAVSLIEHPVWLAAERGDGDPRELVRQLRASESDDARPSELARLGDLLWARGQSVAAHMAWAAARIELDEREAQVMLLPSYASKSIQLAWIGERVGVVGARVSIGVRNERVIELGRPAVEPDTSELLPPILLGEDLEALAVSPAGDRLYTLANGRLTTRALPSSRVIAAEPSTGGPAQLIAIDGAMLLVHGGNVSLRDADGRPIDSFSLTGTTLSKVFVTYDDGSCRREYHPSAKRVTSASMSPDLRHVVVGGSDGEVHVFDRQTGKQRASTRPDPGPRDRPQHRPRAVHATNEIVTAVYDDGLIVRWRMRDGRRLDHAAEQCPTEDVRRVSCDAATHAAISADGELVATSESYGVRVRRAATGELVGAYVGEPVDAYFGELSNAKLAFGRDGRLALQNGQGVTWVVIPGELPRRIWSVDPGPLIAQPKLGGDGRFLASRRERDRWRLWDLERGIDRSAVLGPDEQLLAHAADGSRLAVRHGDQAIEIRRADGSLEQLAHDPSSITLLADDGHLALLDGTHVYDLARARFLDIRIPHDAIAVSASADGSRLAFTDPADGLTIVDTQTEEILARRADARAHLLAPDGEHAAWIERKDAQFVIHRLDIASDSDAVVPITTSVAPRLLALLDRGTAILFVEGTTIHRWSERSIASTETRISSTATVATTLDGRSLFVGYEDRVEIRGSGVGLPLRATIELLPSGDWLASSPAGALDGSPGARHQLLTLADGSYEMLLLGGSVGWDRHAVPGLVALALVGTIAEPPAPHVAPLPPRWATR
jgi:WD40 repeat protein